MYAATNLVLKRLTNWAWDVEYDCHLMWLERSAWEEADFAEAADYADLVGAVVRQMEEVAGRECYVAVPDEFIYSDQDLEVWGFDVEVLAQDETKA